MGDECSPFGEHLCGGLADRPLLAFTGLLRSFCCRERLEGGRGCSVTAKVGCPPHPCSPLVGICVCVWLNGFCIGYPRRGKSL